MRPLPPNAVNQGYLAALAAEADLPVLALPTLRYPTPAQASAHALLCPTRDATPATNAASDLDLVVETIQNPKSKIQNLLAPEQVAARATRPTRTPWRWPGAVAASCRAALGDLAGAGGWNRKASMPRLTR